MSDPDQQEVVETRLESFVDEHTEHLIDECLFCGKKPKFESITAGKLVMFIHECSVVKYRVSPFRSEAMNAIRTWNGLMGQARQRALEHFKKAA